MNQNPIASSRRSGVFKSTCNLQNRMKLHICFGSLPSTWRSLSVKSGHSTNRVVDRQKIRISCKSKLHPLSFLLHRASSPWVRKWVRPSKGINSGHACRTRYITLLCCFQHPKPFLFDVPGCVPVPVVGRAADRANPLPDRQVLNLHIPVAAVGTELATREEGVGLNEGASCPGRLILHLAHELRPAGVCDSPGQLPLLMGQMLHTLRIPSKQNKAYL